MLERILIPLDGSPLAEEILTQIRRILKGKNTEIHLLRTVFVPVSLARIDTGKILEVDRAAARRYLDSLAQRLRKEDIQVRTHLMEGQTAETIVRSAARTRATLIAMTTHGRSGLARWVMGSVAEKVVRSSPVPLLLMRSYTPSGKPVGPVEVGFHRILVPVDGSPNALSVLAAVAPLARDYKADVTVLGVEPPPVVAPAVYGETAYVVPEPPPHAGEDAAEAVAKLAEAGVSAKPMTAKGDPADRILHVADEIKADLIAIATHGRSGWTRFVLGSVTERVLRHSTVPMLIVRAPDTL